MYQEQIIELENPREMLDKLHKMKREEINDTTVSVKDQLQNLKFQLGVDTVFNFNTKFDDLVRRYELVSEMKMSEQDKKDAYYHIISKSVPSVKEATYRDRANEEGDSFTFDQMRIYIQQIEAENKSISQGPRGRGGFMMASAGSAASRCFKCGDRGHYSSSCRRRQGDVKCYRCDGFDHESFEYANNANRLARHGKRTNNISCGGSKRSKPNRYDPNHRRGGFSSRGRGGRFISRRGRGRFRPFNNSGNINRDSSQQNFNVNQSSGRGLGRRGRGCKRGNFQNTSERESKPFNNQNANSHNNSRTGVSRFQINGGFVEKFSN